MPDLSNPLECVESHIEGMRSTARLKREEGRRLEAVATAIEMQADDLESLHRKMVQWAPTDYGDLVERLEAMTSIREQFLFYEQAHRAKGTPEADLKAAIDAGFAEDIRALLDALAEDAA